MLGVAQGEDGALAVRIAANGVRNVDRGHT
jgi:hypothetical protein